MKNSRLAIGIFSIAFLTGCVKEMNPNNASPSNMQPDNKVNVAQAVTDKFVPNELLVRFVKGTSEIGRANALARISANVQEHIVTNAMKRFGDNEGFFVVHTPSAVLDAISKLKGASQIVSAEPNFIYTFGATSNDTYFTNGSLWGMYGSSTNPSNQYGSNAASAWAAGHTGSASVYVGIIDEGIQYTHPDLNGQVWTNTNDPADGIDNDKNGYIDDIHGWDFANNDNTIYDGGTNGRLDDHGTHVSGTIGGIGGNGAGVAGVNWNVTLISAKFLGRNGGTTANAVKAVDYLTNLKTSKNLNIVASNNSWGGGGFSAELYNAIKRASDANILFVAAAGNGGSDQVGDNNDNVDNFPSNYDKTNTVNGVTYPGLSNIIAVAAIDNKGSLASFSNYGSTTVHLGAPGVGIYSTLAYSTYGSYSGTSMATPHVTGTCALYASTHSGASAATIKNAIVSSAVPTSSLSGKTISGGRLDANAALSK